MSVRIVKINDEATAFAVALKFLARKEPFGSAPAGQVGRTVLRAVRRGHVRFAADDRNIVGVSCWALTDAQSARRWREENVLPEGDYSAGDTVVLLIGASDHPQAARAYLRHMAQLYPGRAYMMTRQGNQRTITGRFR